MTGFFFAAALALSKASADSLSSWAFDLATGDLDAGTDGAFLSDLVEDETALATK